MPSISGGQATFGKRLEMNTKNLEEWLSLVVNEIRRLRIGDTSAGEGDAL